MALTGQLTGTNRADIVKQAVKIASRYYDTECVTVTLTDEMTAGGTLFTANWEATLEHHLERRAYGFPECGRCGLQ